LPAILPARDQGAAPFAFRLVAFGTMLLALSIMLAWLRLRSASLWPAILLHAAHNFFIQDIFDPLTAANPQSVWITGEFGAGAAAAYLPLAWILLVNGTRSHGGHGHTA
jgi:membrane protease YdiL (CAAX protease family)